MGATKGNLCLATSLMAALVACDSGQKTPAELLRVAVQAMPPATRQRRSSSRPCERLRYRPTPVPGFR